MQGAAAHGSGRGLRADRPQDRRENGAKDARSKREDNPTSNARQLSAIGRAFHSCASAIRACDDSRAAVGNLDEFDPLIYAPGVAVTPVRARASLEGFDAILLPGSTNTAAILHYLRAEGRAEEIVRPPGAGRRSWAFCGGLQMLSQQLRDPMGLEGAASRAWVCWM